ncbi:hypothetical protein [Chenggangzhangella methanolivorans]|uniref:Uncharacterized protein n=1 Tax=Chenggangzhangella methanolivorans TaxID=1437009 RepID=A0A9E6RBD6_9HYPH|nr:hypothetical protein [Chenggangzhangella methanolivorans]QZO00103.1 hypothetical protein K6K41_26715 [Chenggangzhangella methanolivorans]
MDGWLIAFETGPTGNPLFWAVNVAEESLALTVAAAAADVSVDAPVVSGPNPTRSIETFGPLRGEAAFVGDIGAPRP